MAHDATPHELYEFRFTRRRYGRSTFTWVEVQTAAGEWISLGDPWPCARPTRAELEYEAALHLAAVVQEAPLP